MHEHDKRQCPPCVGDLRGPTSLEPSSRMTTRKSETAARFDVEPLDRGFGHTFGNALRRVLLSVDPRGRGRHVRSASRACCTSSATIEGVKEDVTDIILNLKDLVVGLPQRRARRRCGSRPPAPARSPPPTSPPRRRRDPQPRAAHRHLNADGHLDIDVTVEQGRGYVSAEQNKGERHDRRDPDRLDLLAGPRSPTRSSPPASGSAPTTTSSVSTSRPTVRSPRATRSRRPATPFAPWSASSPT